MRDELILRGARWPAAAAIAGAVIGAGYMFWPLLSNAALVLQRAYLIPWYLWVAIGVFWLWIVWFAYIWAAHFMKPPSLHLMSEDSGSTDLILARTSGGVTSIHSMSSILVRGARSSKCEGGEAKANPQSYGLTSFLPCGREAWSKPSGNLGPGRRGLIRSTALDLAADDPQAVLRCRKDTVLWAGMSWPCSL
jgi:hypothetical protein